LIVEVDLIEATIEEAKDACCDHYPPVLEAFIRAQCSALSVI